MTGSSSLSSQRVGRGRRIMSQTRRRWFGREDFPPSMLRGLPRYLLMTLSIFGRFLTRRQRAWQQRTERDTDQREGRR